MWFDGSPITVVLPTTLSPDVRWQVEQAWVILAWFVVQCLKPPGMVVSIWQEEQSSVVETWFGINVLSKGGLGKVPVTDAENVCPLWQLVQPEVMPAWLIVQF